MDEVKQVINFWFTEIEPAQWFKKDVSFDELIRTRFGKLHTQAIAGELWLWRQHLQGRLAEIIILDQFSRNIYRDDARAFSADLMALALAQEAILQGLDQQLTAIERTFLYMPYMHSESLKVHQQGLALFKSNGLESNYQFELKHLKIIERFGRYPHRNELLGRTSTIEELAFLAQPGSSF
ncbi:DUF924 family protein [Shewanella sp. 10N.286.48.B5]|uniref:DUF924 family protein n=1 Tax=Shewanella sp. 10N.286.48.B5 TaxID=1880834 RepID=UPI000C83A9F4|nr:DUF924 family protein [Shewanella sp. 10N.286.48.B5]PMH88122.1 hypothetical protein BCU57_04870 [Shewanella sp. 10N.286.48.B5]